MPSEFIQALPQLQSIIEKLGVVGLLIIALGWLSYERVRLLKEATACYKSREKWRVAYAKCKAALEAANIKIDLTDLLENEDKS